MVDGGCVDSIVQVNEIAKVRFCNWVRFLTTEESSSMPEKDQSKTPNLECNVSCDSVEAEGQVPLQYRTSRAISAGEELVVSYRRECRYAH